MADDLAVARAKRSLDKDIADATAVRATIYGDASTAAAYDMIIAALKRARAALEPRM